MRFIVDAQLPARLAAMLEDHGHDAVHVTSMADQDRTRDEVVCRFADEEDGVVITKDSDFRDSQTLGDSPRHLLRIMTGNIGNTELLALVGAHLSIWQARTERRERGLSPCLLPHRRQLRGARSGASRPGPPCSRARPARQV